MYNHVSFHMILFIQVIEEEKLQENCTAVGTYMLKCLEALRDKYEIIGDVRGKVLRKIVTYAIFFKLFVYLGPNDWC